eukprot:8652711-Pyramimonas_sp.AAC.1
MSALRHFSARSRADCPPPRLSTSFMSSSPFDTASSLSRESFAHDCVGGTGGAQSLAVLGDSDVATDARSPSARSLGCRRRPC